MQKEEIHKWLVKYSLLLHNARKAIESETELYRFDESVRAFLETCPNWWSNDSDGDLQATQSPDLFWQAVIAEHYPYQSFNDAEELRQTEINSQFGY